MYFDKPGAENTENTLLEAYKRAAELGISEVVVASSSGDTALKTWKVFKDFKVVAVTYHCGFNKPFKNVLKQDARKKLEDNHITVVSATHALSGVERAAAKKFSGIYPALLIAETLRMFGQGTKVAVEIAIMAADAGALSGKDIVSIGGTAKGADTALILQPVNQSDLFEMKIREIICKPRIF